MTVLRGSRWSGDCRYTSKFNIYIIIAFVPGSVLDTTLCHRQICRELKFPPFWERHYLQYPRLDSGATRQVAPIVFHDLRFTEPKSVSTARRWKTTRFTFVPNKYVYCLPEGARTRYNRLRNDPVVQLLRFTTKIRAKASSVPRQKPVSTYIDAWIYMPLTLAALAIFFPPLYLSPRSSFPISLHRARSFALDELASSLLVSHYDTLYSCDTLRSSHSIYVHVFHNSFCVYSFLVTQRSLINQSQFIYN